MTRIADLTLAPDSLALDDESREAITGYVVFARELANRLERSTTIGDLREFERWADENRPKHEPPRVRP